jgi:DNA-binding CsgD family transcriptional regulator
MNSTPQPQPLAAFAGPSPSAVTLALMVDALSWPLWLLRRDATVLHANAAAHRLLRSGHPLALVAGARVTPAAADQRPAFDVALQQAARGAPQLLQGGGAALAWTASLSPLTDPRAEPQATVLLLALGTDEGRAGGLRAYARLHRLTAAETRVLIRLAGGEGSTAAAAALGVSPATVRSQTLSLRQKTGHATVAALLRAVASLPPLAGLGDDGE